jgi:endonuclease-3
MKELPNEQAPVEVRLPHIMALLRAAHPDAHCALNYNTPFELLMATILSAQCTDVRVNQVTPVLFARYPVAGAMAAADRSELEEIIRSTGFFRQKARYLQETAQEIVHEHQGKVPADMHALCQFPGVARKTANVVLGEIFDIAEGIVVDTHVSRVAQRLRLTTETSATRIEKALMDIIPRENWIEISHLFIFHGRRVCHARRPDCAHCTLVPLCPARQI